MASDVAFSLQSIPFYIFCESYGGKMAAAFALSLQKVCLRNKVELNIGRSMGGGGGGGGVV